MWWASSWKNFSRDFVEKRQVEIFLNRKAQNNKNKVKGNKIVSKVVVRYNKRSMNNILCLIKHKWVYRTENVTTYPPKVIHSNTMFGTGYYSGQCDSDGNPLPVKYDIEVRLCERCKKKQRVEKKLVFDGKPPHDSKWVPVWVDCELNQEDIRDIKLEDIGI